MKTPHKFFKMISETFEHIVDIIYRITSNGHLRITSNGNQRITSNSEY